MFNKKGISPVVATALLLVVAVISVVGFQGWFTNFSSSVFTDVETQTSNPSSNLKIEGIINNQLYLNSKQSNLDLDSLKIINSKGIETCSFDSLSTPNNNSGLIGYWELNDGGLIINDLSGNNNHGKLYGTTKLVFDFDTNTGSNIIDKTNFQNNGTVFGATWTNSDCVTGGCYDFDGINDYISINISQNLDFTDTFSISLWAKFDDITNTQTLFSSWSPTTDGMYIQKSSDHKIAIVNKLSSPVNVVRDGNFIVNTSNFNNYIFTVSKDKVTGYRNGKLVDTFNGDFQYLINNSAFHIGRHVSNHYPFNGKIDEFSIYGKALTQTEVDTLYTSQKVQFFDYKDNSVYFDGQSTKVEILDSPILDGLNEISIVAKFKPYSTNGGTVYNKMLQQSGLGSDDAYILNVMDNNFRDVSSNLTNYYFHSHPYDKLTEFTTVKTFDSTTNKFYINGFLVGNGTQISGPINSVDSNLYFGAAESKTMGFFTFFEGLISEIKIYNKILNQSEVERLYFDLSKNKKGITKIDVSGCNLDKGEKYEIVGTSNTGLINVEVISK